MSEEKLREARAESAANSAAVTDGAETKLVVPRSLEAASKKHPLNTSWTLWYDSISTYDSERWELSLVEVMTVRTVEEFFTMLHYCKPPHVLRVSAQYHFFREGVKPMWEDPRNKAGGKLWISLDDKTVGDAGKKWENATTAAAAAGGEKDGTSVGTNNSGSNHGAKVKKDEHEAEKKPELDAMWENLLMAMVGEYLDPEPDGEHIMGLVLSRRKYHNRIALWLRDASASEAVARIEKRLVKEAGLPPSVKLIFTPHSTGKM
ncbi:eukaryotic translation initiation factor eIF-4E [Trypanosoma conorhini]|uniref:Eukaryotic translation initiation factor eIF-4E n=1 Tax=Trypanosoma conorhini TaxID=83891 RepID=A0A3R7L2J0_9TRYP|nr:eukaryotic translation initiation factor eIF-4E [Trypanosoma conorhini]RNF15059.1 eukaryotic translation initiation factor eIF-4E [Trypanosoma conorhini]